MGIITDDVIIDISAFIRTLKTHKVIMPCYSFKMIPKISKHFTYVSCRLSCFHCTLQANLIKPSPLNHKLACSCDKLAISSAFCLYTCLPACLWITKQVPQCLLKVRQLRGRHPLRAILGNAPIDASWFLCCASPVDGGCLDFPMARLYAEMNWHALLEHPSKDESEKVRESTVGRANPRLQDVLFQAAIFNRGLQLPQRRMQECNDFDWAAHTGAMFWPELEAHLYHSCCCALFTSGQSETTNKGLWPWEVP